MKPAEIQRLSADELWKLHLEIGAALAAKLAAQKQVLEGRLQQLQAKPFFERRIAGSDRRKYPPVFPKFRNPDVPSETWAGRGKQPRWLAKQLSSGKAIDEFRIEMAAE